MRVDIVTTVSNSAGWAPIHHFGTLLAGLFDTVPIQIDNSKRGLIERLRPQGPIRKPKDGDILIAIVRSPAELPLLRRHARIKSGYAKIAVWIIDSFRTDISPPASDYEAFDVLAITQSYDLDFYRARTKGAVIVLPWGADGLTCPNTASRPVDLQRLGRQPEAWDDDATLANAARSHGLSTGPRPRFGDTPRANQQNVLESLSQAKFVLAFSNLAAPASYTHATKAYFTARWADALICGASVAGIPPLEDQAFADLLWPGALLKLDTLDLDAGLATVAKAVADWTPQQAALNRHNALLRLDWRWRIKALAEALGLSSPKLDSDLARLKHLADEVMAI